VPVHLPPINRRHFIAGSLAAGAAIALPRQVWAQTAPTDPNLFVLASDIHITEDRNTVRHDVKSPETFEAVRSRILSLPSRPAGVVFCGDCASHHGEVGDYATLVELLKPLREAGIPLHLTLGNHDDRGNFLKALPDHAAQAANDVAGAGKFASVWETAQVNWFLLDSLVRPNKPALLVAHHQLATDYYVEHYRIRGLFDTPEFLDIVLPRKQVKAYIFGHLHRWDHGQTEGLPWVNIPSTAWGSPDTEPTGHVTMQLCPKGATLQLNALDQKHPKHGDKIELTWRT
jgi:3',5'-cyclic AMP phosphodiesterase CpdA